MNSLSLNDFRLHIMRNGLELAADDPVADMAYNYASNIIGDFTISVSRLDYCCDVFWTQFAATYPEFVKEIKRPAPFSDASNRAEFLIMAFDWYSKNKSKLPIENTEFVSNKLSILFVERNKILHSYFHRMNIEKDHLCFFQKLKKIGDKKTYSNGSKGYSKFEFFTYEFRTSKIIELTDCSNDCADYLIGLLELTKK